MPVRDEIKIDLDDSQFTNSMQEALEITERVSDRFEKLQAEIDASRDLLEGLGEAARVPLETLESIEDKTVTVDLDTTDFEASIEAGRAALESLSDQRISMDAMQAPPVDVQVGDVTGGGGLLDTALLATTAATNVAKIPDKDVKVTVDSSGFESAMEGIEKTLADVTGGFAGMGDSLKQARVEMDKTGDEAAKLEASIKEGLSLEDTRESLDTTAGVLGGGFSQGMAKALAIVSDGNKVFDEQQQKIRDARKKLDEFGATAEQQERALSLIGVTAASNNVVYAKTAGILEELAIETQDTEKAIANLDGATQFHIRSQLRLEESTAKFTETLRGETSAFEFLSPRADRLGKILKDVSDVKTRARLTTKLLNEELQKETGTVDKLRDNWNIARFELAKFTGGFDLLGPAATGAGLAIGAVTAAVVAGSAAVIDYTVDATELYIEMTPEYAREIDNLEAAQKNLEFTTGQVVAENLNLKDATIEAQVGIDLATRAISGFKSTFDVASVSIEDAAEKMQLVGIAARFAFSALSSDVNAIPQLIQDFKNLQEVQERFTKDVEISTERVEQARTIRRKLLAGEMLSTEELLRVQADEMEFAEVLGVVMKRQTEDFKDNSKAVDANAKKKLAQGRALAAAARKAERERKRREKEARESTIDFSAFEAEEEFARMRAEADKIRDERNQRFFENEQRRIDERIAKIRSFQESGDADLLAGLSDFDVQVAQQARDATVEMERMQTVSQETGQAVSDFIGGGFDLATQSMVGFVQTMAQGTFSLTDFTAGLVSTMGDLLIRMGQSFVLIGSGFQSLEAGVLAPGALITIGLGAIAMGAAFKGFANRGGGGSGGAPTSTSSGAAAAGGSGFTQPLQFPSQRIDSEEDTEEGRNVTLQIGDGEFRGFLKSETTDINRRGRRNGGRKRRRTRSSVGAT